MSGCTVPGCERPHEASGLCGTHYARLRRTGTTERMDRRNHCAEPDCDWFVDYGGLCHMHAERLRRSGTTASPIRRSFRQRFEEKVDRSGDCWIWTGTAGRDGYGQISSDQVSNRMLYAHRVSYELHVGPIPEGLEIDHVCHTDDPSCPGGPCLHRRCVNPAHLEPVTAHENQRRARQRKRRSA